MSVEIKLPRKLIEVALPLDDINKEAAREKSIRHGHPSTLHLWWARRPLAAARAVIFAQMVNDPGYDRKLGYGVNKDEAKKERDRLFALIKRLCQWENTNNAELLREARQEIWKSWREICALNKNHPQADTLFNPEKLPPFHDPFSGGGSIPLEAQKLGLEVYASDLNPVAVTITKAMIEIPHRFLGYPSVFLGERKGRVQKLIEDEHPGLAGLTEDVLHYGSYVRDLAFAKIGNLYSPIQITSNLAKDRVDLKALIGERLTVIAWIWARTAKCENPACGLVFPLIKSLSLSKRNKVALQPTISQKSISFSPRFDAENEVPGNVTRRSVQCWFCDASMKLSEIEKQGRAGNMGNVPIAVIAEGRGKRVYLGSDAVDIPSIPQSLIENSPSCQIEHWRSCTNCVVYGFDDFGKLFLDRQKAALNAFAEAVTEVKSRILSDALQRGLKADGIPFHKGGAGAEAYADAIQTYLALSVSKLADRCSSFCGWDSSRDSMRNTFARQAIPMVWEFSESNPFSDSTGNFLNGIEWITECFSRFSPNNEAHVALADASTQEISRGKVVSTDPPYYDNIPYSNLSDFFYIWLRKMLKNVDPDLFQTIAARRDVELVANKHRHGGKKEAEVFFLNGMQKVMRNLQSNAHPAYPITIFYAFKQTETDVDNGTSSTGWETFLQAVIDSGFVISGTWPVRTELSNRMLGSDSNALASSIVLVCTRRESSAQIASRREFLRELNSTLPEALLEMTRGGTNSPIAPVDLSQSIIGPGMGIFSQYSAVLEADGKPMTVKTALTLINRFLAEDDFDHDTQFCLHWFESHRWDAGRFGEADVLSRAKGTSVDSLKEGGVLESSRGNVRLYRWEEFSAEWNPEKDKRLSIWEILHQLIRKTNFEGEKSGGALLAKVHRHGEPVRTLAYRLYTICERQGWATEASAYNNFILAWEALESVAQEIGYSGVQRSLFGDEEPLDDSKVKRGRTKK
jgi:putative DNA methylase